MRAPWGRLFLVALRLDRWPEAEVWKRADLALRAGVGGFLVFGGRTETVGRLTRELRSAAGRALWLASDLERGPGQQFEGEPTLPPPRALAAHPDPEEAAEAAGRATGEGARRLGINWALAPVLDLDVEARNPIVGTRSFGSDPERVGRLGTRWVEACQAAGVAACAKHFPGHGRTRSDSHLERPVVEASAATLRGDLRPFGAVAGRVVGMMSAHIAYPSLGSEEAASLSPEILTDLLRRELGFEGLTISDAMIMAGFRAGEAAEGALAVRALSAGNDLLLYPRDLAGSLGAVTRAARRRPALRRRLERSVERSERLASAWDIALDGEAGPHRGPASHLDTLSERCLVGRGGGRLTAGWSRRRPTELIVETDEEETPGGGDAETGRAFRSALVDRGWRLAAETGGEPSEVGGEAEAPQRLVLLFSTPRGWKGRAGPTEEALARIRSACAPQRSGAVVFGHLRILDALGVKGVCAWSGEPAMQRAAAAWLDRRVG